jgi:hypothetical protein
MHLQKKVSLIRGQRNTEGEGCVKIETNSEEIQKFQGVTGGVIDQ